MSDEEKSVYQEKGKTLYGVYEVHHVNPCDIV